MRYLALLTVFILLLGCCDDFVSESLKLSNFDKELIPYTSYQDINFIDQDENIILAKCESKMLGVQTNRKGPESCELTQYEYLLSKLNFQSLDITLELLVSAAPLNTNFTIESSYSNSFPVERYDLACDQYSIEIQEQFTDIIINQFEFQNVLVFTDCSEMLPIKLIVFSIENGIEYIEFENLTWLKLHQ